MDTTMALSDADREAIDYVRHLANNLPGSDREPLDRVLRLAGEPIPEPEPGTFWWDPEYREVLYREVGEAPYPWHRTDNAGHIWDEFSMDQRLRLVQLVPASPEPDGSVGTEILMSLLGAWEAQHREKCGRSVGLSKCGYGECKSYWRTLHNYGVRATWESME